MIIDEIVKSGLVKKLTEINFQGNETQECNYKSILSEHGVMVEG